MAMEQLTKHFASDAKGWYEDNRRWNAENETYAVPMQYFAHKAADEYGVYPEENELRRREQHFLRKFHVRENDSPLRHEQARQYAWDSHALEALWKDAGVYLRGPMATTIEKAFATSSSLQGTFPIFFDQQIVAGRLTVPVGDRLVAERVTVNSGLANHTEMAESATDRQVVETAEGARTVQKTVKIRERQIALKKFGFEALATYEAVRRARLPVFARTLERIGQQFEILLTDFRIDVLVLGDGTTPSNAAATVAAAVAGSPTYADYVNLILGGENAYQWDLLVANKEAIVEMLNVTEFKDPLAGFSFQNRGVIPSPFGVELLRWDTTGDTTAWPNSANNSKILAMEQDMALVEYTEGGVLSESDRLIESQWERTVITQWVGWGIMDPNARIVGTGFA